jgi:Mlc titration factor MtfA (ptsG expression regulator)
MGAVGFSWEGFKHGYQIEDDKMNLGLHEMTHTLLLQVSDDKFDTYIDNWFSAGRKEFSNIRAGNSVMFRSYAGTNRYEFLSVAVECFFEAPKEFEEKLPEIYNSMKILLNQDPQNSKNDYFFAPKKDNSLKDVANSKFF